MVLLRERRDCMMPLLVPVAWYITRYVDVMGELHCPFLTSTGFWEGSQPRVLGRVWRGHSQGKASRKQEVRLGSCSYGPQIHIGSI